MIKLYIGFSSSESTMLWPEHQKHPREYIEDVKEHIKEIPDPVITTYSQRIVNCIGLMISRGELGEDDVVLFLESPSVAYCYDKDGFLINWPTGWFDHVL